MTRLSTINSKCSKMGGVPTGNIPYYLFLKPKPNNDAGLRLIYPHIHKVIHRQYKTFQDNALLAWLQKISRVAMQHHVGLFILYSESYFKILNHFKIKTKSNLRVPGRWAFFTSTVEGLGCLGARNPP